MKIFNQSNNNFLKDLKSFLDFRNEQNFDILDQEVKEIIDSVKLNGDSALIDYTEKFDNHKISNSEILIPQEVKNKYRLMVDKKIIKSFEISIKNITNFHNKQFPSNYEIVEDNIKIGSLWNAIDSVGLYVPGGKATYPSSLLMNVIPAKIAGVKRIVVATPSTNGNINPYIIALLDILEIHEVYQIGGSQAIAALAYGTETIKPVNKIFGPGNKFVSNAKKQVFGKVGIDLIAGPSEIVVVADKDNNSQWVASDLLAQAEHDEKAQSILITDDESFGKKVLNHTEKLLEGLSKKEIITKSLNNFGAIIILESLITSPEIINMIAPEHLHLQNKTYEEILKNVRNVGSIFVGPYTSEAFGDYIVGTNHILPTSGSAKFSSGLGVLDFMKRSSYVYMNQQSYLKLANNVADLATIEELDAHKLSVTIRQNNKK